MWLVYARGAMKWGILPIALIFTSISVMGCGAADDPDDPENIDSASQALDELAHAQVLVTGYDSQTRVVSGELDGEPVTFEIGIKAVLGIPPDPYIPEGKCGTDAVKWLRILGKAEWDYEKRHEHLVTELLPKLARDTCTCTIGFTVGAEGIEVHEFIFPAEAP